MKKSIIIIEIVAMFLFSGCAVEGWSLEERESIGTLQISTPIYEEKAYDNPTTRIARYSVISNNFSTFTAILEATNYAIEQGKYNSDNSAQYPALKKLTYDNRNQSFGINLENSIREIEFFKNIIKTNGESKLKVEITDQRFYRAKSTSIESMKLYYSITGHVSLINKNGKTMYYKHEITGVSDKTATISELVYDNGKILREMMEEAEKDFANQVRGDLFSKVSMAGK